MRRLVMTTILALAAATPAYCGDMKLLTDQQVTDLESRVRTAEPKEQCFLYAELIAQMAERVDQQIAAGEMDKASGYLNRMNDYTTSLHGTMGNDSKKLKDAEILIRHTTARMHGMAHAASYENREVLHTVEAKLGALEAEMMLNVFRR